MTSSLILCITVTADNLAGPGLAVKLGWPSLPPIVFHWKFPRTFKLDRNLPSWMDSQSVFQKPIQNADLVLAERRYRMSTVK